jgi:hydrogenase/urease accessory protein HupE
MILKTILILLAFVGGAAHADVLDHHNGFAAQLAHQIFGAHHIPFTLLLIVVGVISIRGWRAARTKV